MLSIPVRQRVVTGGWKAEEAHIEALNELGAAQRRVVLDAVQKWADADLRSLNAQIEFLLRRSLSDANRLKPPPPTPPPPDPSNS